MTAKRSRKAKTKQRRINHQIATGRTIEEYDTGPITERRPRYSYALHMSLCDAKHWYTANGRRIAIKNMEDSHVINTVRWLRRRAPKIQLAQMLQTIASLPRMRIQVDDERNQMLEDMSIESVEDFLWRTCPPYKALLSRYPGAKKRVDEKNQAWLDEAVYDPWGNN